MLATVCGYSFAEIDELTHDDFSVLDAYWQQHPPLHLMAAAYLGVKPSKKQKADPSDLIRNLSGQAGWTVRTMH